MVVATIHYNHEIKIGPKGKKKKKNVVAIMRLSVLRDVEMRHYSSYTLRDAQRGKERDNLEFTANNRNTALPGFNYQLDKNMTDSFFSSFPATSFA